MTDEEIRATMQATVKASTEEVAKRMVETHLKKSAHLGIVTAACMNPGKDPWKANEGVVLVEICQDIPDEENASFEFTEFGPQRGWPRLKILLVSPGTLNLDLVHGASGSFCQKLLHALRHGKAKCVFPRITGMRAAAKLEELLGPAEPA